MKAIKFLFFLFFAIVSSVSAFAQSTPCLKIESIKGDNHFTAGESIQLKAVVNKEIATIGARFKWKLSAGKIADGENANSISIESDELGGQEITVTVEVEGIAGLCEKSDSFTFKIESVIGCGLISPIDNFSINDEWKQISVRLDNFAIELLNHRDFVAKIISHKSKGDSLDKIKAHLLKIKKYLTVKRKVSAKRIILFLSEDNNGDESYTELYLLPEDIDYFNPDSYTVID